MCPDMADLEVHGQSGTNLWIIPKNMKEHTKGDKQLLMFMMSETFEIQDYLAWQRTDPYKLRYESRQISFLAPEKSFRPLSDTIYMDVSVTSQLNKVFNKWQFWRKSEDYS